MTALRQRMIDDIRIRNFLPPETIKTYIYKVSEFAKHFRQAPR